MIPITDSWKIAIDAFGVMVELHEGQKRKYSGDSYFVHPLRVAIAVIRHDIASPETVAAALLHDVLEDTEYRITDLDSRFGSKVGMLVDELTNKTHGLKLPRAERKLMDRERLEKVSHEARVIKLIDRIDNLSDGWMEGAENQFKALYCDESELLLNSIGHADQGLKQELMKAIDKVRSLLKRKK